MVKELDVCGGDMSGFHVVEETIFHCVWKCCLYVKEEDRSYFLCSPCILDFVDYEVHSVSDELYDWLYLQQGRSGDLLRLL